MIDIEGFGTFKSMFHNALSEVCEEDKIIMFVSPQNQVFILAAGMNAKKQIFSEMNKGRKIK